MISSLLTMIIFGLGLDSPTSFSPTDPKIKAFVDQLASINFREREKAALSLEKIGLAAIPAIKMRSNSEDLELRERCKKLIPNIQQHHRDRKISELVSAGVSKIPNGLPCIDNFLTLIGDSKEARLLYAEMAKDHWHLLESIDFSPAETRERFAKFIDKLNDQRKATQDEAMRLRNSKRHVPLIYKKSDLTIFLFTRSQCGKDQKYDYYTSDIPENFIDDSNIDNATFPSSQVALFKAWFRTERDVDLVGSATNIVWECKIKETIPTMLKWINANETPGATKMKFLTCIGQLGDKRFIKDIEPLLTNKEVVYKSIWCTSQGDRVTKEIILGDIALNVCWIWSGQKQTDLGLHPSTVDDSSPFDLHDPPWFLTVEDRQAALAKWKKIRTKMLAAENKTLK